MQRSDAPTPSAGGALLPCWASWAPARRPTGVNAALASSWGRDGPRQPAGNRRRQLRLTHQRARPRPRRGQRRSLTLGIYLTQRWLPSKRISLRPTTWDSCRRNIDLHVLPRLGRVPLRNLRPDHLERLSANLLANGHAQRAGGLDNKTVLEIPMVLRRALDDAVRRGMLLAQPGRRGNAPKRPLASAASRAWDAQQLRRS